MNKESLTLLERFNKHFTAPLMVIFTALTVVGGFFINANSSKLADLKTRVDTELEQKEFNNSLKTELIEQVKDAVSGKTRDSAVLRLTLLSINTLLTDTIDSLFKEGLTTILVSANKDLMATQSIIDSFKNIQSYMFADPTNKFNVGIFYLDDNHEGARQSAENIKNKIIALYGKDFNVRVRSLPSYINAQSNYRLNANTLRYDTVDNPKPMQVYNLIVDSNLLPGNNPVLQQVTHPKRNNYMWLFVREK